MVRGNEFLEWADVFGNLYGTCSADTERDLEAGQDVVLVIDEHAGELLPTAAAGSAGRALRTRRKSKDEGYRKTGIAGPEME